MYHRGKGRDGTVLTLEQACFINTDFGLLPLHSILFGEPAECHNTYIISGHLANERQEH